MDEQKFSIDLACKYGVDGAIMIDFLRRVLETGKFLNQKLHENRAWVYMPVWQLNCYLPFWTEAQIAKVLNSLVYYRVLLRKSIPELGKAKSYAFL